MRDRHLVARAARRSAHVASGAKDRVCERALIERRPGGDVKTARGDESDLRLRLGDHDPVARGRGQGRGRVGCGLAVCVLGARSRLLSGLGSLVLGLRLGQRWCGHSLKPCREVLLRLECVFDGLGSGGELGGDRFDRLHSAPVGRKRLLGAHGVEERLVVRLNQRNRGAHLLVQLDEFVTCKLGEVVRNLRKKLPVVRSVHVVCLLASIVVSDAGDLRTRLAAGS